jgi:cell division transport system permease protein
MQLIDGFKSGSVWLKRVLTNAWHSLMRNKILSTATILIIALMIFVFNLILALSFATESVISSVGEKLDISVEINTNVENYTIQTFVEKLKGRAEIKDVLYVSKEDALDSFGSKYPNVISFLDHHNLENPLPDIVRIVSRNIEDNNVIINYLESSQFSSIINQQKLKENLDQKTRNEKILNITRFIQKTGFWLNFVFALVAVMIIFNSINMNIHTHKKEINIMKLVGAKYSFIRAGFIFEGVTLAILALFISIGLSKLILGYLAKNLVGIISNETLLTGLNSILLHFEDKFWLTLGWQFLAAVIAGIISSYLAIELYLRKEHSF